LGVFASWCGFDEFIRRTHRYNRLHKTHYVYF